LNSNSIYSQAGGNANFYNSRPLRSDSSNANGPKPRSPSPVRSGSSGPSLPPGAMQPASVGEQLWLASLPSEASSVPNGPSSPPRSRPARSPPPSQYSNHDWNGNADWDVSVGGAGGKPPARSLSANAVTGPNAVNSSTLKKKAPSAAAVKAERRPRTSEGTGEEDVPLAVWQHQRRK